MGAAFPSILQDRHGRRIDTLRVSVTDRCDLRCRYCMAEDMRFLPRADLLSLDEIVALCDAFIARGVRRIRLTGGEPLMRRGLPDLARAIGRHLGLGIDELTLTTNATRLEDQAEALAAAGIRRVNISLDTRDPTRFRSITRTGDLARLLRGIAAAKAAGLTVKINMVALKALNEDEIAPMLRWCGEQGFDLTLIETMPLGLIEEDRTAHYLPLDAVRRDLERHFTLLPDGHRTSGPARYVRVAETGGRLGFITPLTHNFCESCNRMRITASGRLYACLGHDEGADLGHALRSGGPAALQAGIDAALALKPARHDFRIAAASGPAVARHMSVTGG